MKLDIFRENNVFCVFSTRTNLKLPTKLISHSGGQLDNRPRGKIILILNSKLFYFKYTTRIRLTFSCLVTITTEYCTPRVRHVPIFVQRLLNHTRRQYCESKRKYIYSGTFLFIWRYPQHDDGTLLFLTIAPLPPHAETQLWRGCCR